jgi:hypothetical protein
VSPSRHATHAAPAEILRPALLAATLVVALQQGSTPVRAQDVPPAPRFVNEAPAGHVQADEGHVTLSWTLPGFEAAEECRFELERSWDAGFADPRRLHDGTESTVFLSGLKAGPTWFRVRGIHGDRAGPWSPALVVDTEYPQRSQVLVLFVVGCIVFAATVAAILLGWARHRPAGAENRAGA